MVMLYEGEVPKGGMVVIGYGIVLKFCVVVLSSGRCVSVLNMDFLYTAAVKTDGTFVLTGSSE